MKNGSRLRAAAATACLAATLLGASCSETATNTNTATTTAPKTANANLAATTNTGQPMNTGVALGQEVYTTSCASCHDESGKGKELFARQGIPDFTDASWQKKESDDHLLDAIRNGKGPIMPPWKDKLSEEEIQAVLAFVRSFPERVSEPAAASNTNATTK